MSKNFIRGALVFCAAIRQSLFRQNVLTENLSNFSFVKASRYTVGVVDVNCLVGTAG